MNPEPAHNPPWPEYCCAILRDHLGRFLLELRPDTAPNAPGLLTCYGGAREPGEDPRRCIERELREELGLAAIHLSLALRLVSGPREIAWFYRGTLPADTRLRTEPGRSPRLFTPDELRAAPLSQWHRAAIAAASAGVPVVNV